MVAAARKYNRVVQAGTWQRSGDHFQQACEMVRTGVLGKVSDVQNLDVSESAASGHRQSSRRASRPPVWIGICGWDRRPSGSFNPTASVFIRMHILTSASSGIMPAEF